MSICPEAVFGDHGDDGTGKCPWCGAFLYHKGRPGPDPTKRSQARRAQDPLSIDGPDEGDYLDGFGGVA